MSEVVRRVLMKAAVLAAAGLALSATNLGATHFSWLGHDACPWPSAVCESRVPSGFRALGELRYGVYHIADEAAPEWQGEARTESLKTRGGELIAHVGPRFRRQLDADGAGRLRDGRILNGETQIDGEWRYLVVENAPFGIGAPGYKLMPYRTMTVNSRRIRLGSVLYVPSLAGLKLPSGEVHDGFCFAHDTEDEDDDAGISLFVGFDRDTAPTLRPLAARPTLRVYEVDGETAAVLNRRFKSRFEYRD